MPYEATWPLTLEIELEKSELASCPKPNYVDVNFTPAHSRTLHAIDASAPPIEQRLLALLFDGERDSAGGNCRRDSSGRFGRTARAEG